MKHARDDYNRIQDPAGLIPADEPVMLFRAQDRYAATVLEYYANIVEANGGDPEIVRLTRDQCTRFRTWPKHKEPDLAETSGSGK